MFSFFKKLFSKQSETADLMNQAMMQVIEEKAVNGSLFSSDTSGSFNGVDDDLDLLQQQALENHQMMTDEHLSEMQRFQEQNQWQQEMDQLQFDNNPYMNPGQDIVADEHHHHLDHGFDDGNHHDPF